MNNCSARQLGWDEDMSQSKRRAAVLEKCHNRPLKAGKIMLNTAKRGVSDEARRKATADSSYFFKLHERQKER
jgi:hypothetical protein